MNWRDSFSPEQIGRFEAILAKYGKIKGSLITILQQTQGVFGFLPRGALSEVATATQSTIARVLGVATFYTQFRFQPIGKYLILLCKGTACHVNNSDSIAQAVFEELGITNGQTTDDGLFSLVFVACLGCCSLSPVMMINDDTYGSLTPDKAKRIIKQIKGEQTV